MKTLIFLLLLTTTGMAQVDTNPNGTQAGDQQKQVSCQNVCSYGICQVVCS